MTEGNGASGFRRKDTSHLDIGMREREAGLRDVQMVRDMMFASTMQAITIRDHGPDVEKWGRESAEEANGLLAGLGDYDFRELMVKAQANPSTFDILAELKKLNKDIPSDA